MVCTCQRWQFFHQKPYPSERLPMGQSSFSTTNNFYFLLILWNPIYYTYEDKYAIFGTMTLHGQTLSNLTCIVLTASMKNNLP